jgi:hypothetical protein
LLIDRCHFLIGRLATYCAGFLFTLTRIFSTNSENV